jgi:hypothetical protein
MLVTEEIFEAFLKCETKSYLKLSGAVGSRLEFTDWRQQIIADYKQKCSDRLPSGIQNNDCIPIRFVPNERIINDDKLLLAFDALALSNNLGKVPLFGRIIYGNNQTSVRVKLADLIEKARSVVNKIAAQQYKPHTSDAYSEQTLRSM